MQTKMKDTETHYHKQLKTWKKESQYEIYQ